MCCLFRAASSMLIKGNFDSTVFPKKNAGYGADGCKSLQRLSAY
jgi:hypothetical protein